MAAGTLTGYLRVVKVCRYPAAGGVAIGTVIGTDDMIRILARSDIAVVTAEATTLHIGVIDLGCRSPSGDLVTGLTHLGRLYVSTMLAACRRAIMATGAVTADSRVVIGAGTPRDGIVAIITALTIGGDMRSRQASGDDTVMTTGTGSNHCSMIDADDVAPTEGRVTELTPIGREYVIGILLLAWRCRPVMALGAIG